MGKANITMICNIEELSSLFDKSKSLDDFLQAAVSVVAYHMRSAVCSIYIYDPATQLLTLRATQGLSREAIGNVHIPLGQGLVGLALKELHPVCAGIASENPAFLPIEGIGEENYKAFMAVPIRRQLSLVGVLAVQDVQPNYFNETDEQALKSIAVQLATVIENANMLMMMRHKTVEPEETRPKERPHRIHGRPASDGVALGKARLIVSGRTGRFHAPAAVPANLTLEHFDRAVTESEQQLKTLQFAAGAELSDVAQLIFSAHLLILEDVEFTGQIRTQIQQGIAPTDALVDVVNRYADIFSASTNPRLQEKVHDLKDLGHRLLENLIGEGHADVNYSGQIILADSLLPSDVLKLTTQKAEGFIIQGGVTAHIAIICRSLHKPMIMLDADLFELIDADCELLIDGSSGTIYIQPSNELLAEHERLTQENCALDDSPTMSNETFTADGTRIHLYANINLLSDLALANSFRAEGVGLYRSEFPFLIRDAFPMEEEQYQIYRQLIETMNGREVTFRTLDIGGDKLISTQNALKENNPFLGLRGIRFLLKNKDLFTEQLCAMLRAGANSNARIMFPMISSLDEFDEARDMVHTCMDMLEKRGVSFNRETKLGIMVELPSAVERAEDFAREVDFMSIGTNDLIQYMLAVDRTNAMVSKLYLSYHPAILSAIERVATAGKLYGTDVSICGDIARDPKMIPFLMGVGITKLSIAPRRMPVIQRAIESVHQGHAVHTARTMLNLRRFSEVEAFLNGR